MAPALAFGCSWFWIVTVIFVFWAIACVEASTSTASGASFVIILYLALLHYFGNLNPFPWMLAHPAQTLGIVLLYLAGGTFWAVLKWRFFVYSKARQCEELRVILGRQNGWTAKSFSALGSNERKEIFQAAGLKRVPPSVIDEKQRITAWMVWWPLSAAWTIVDDPIRRAFQHIYHRIAAHLQTVSNSAFEEINGIK